MRSGLRRLGVLGGTFDPIHTGHLIAASEARHAFRLDEVLFVPAGKPWQKSDYSDAEDRYMLTTLAVADDPGFAVSRIELDRRGPTYTVDTLRVLRDFHSGNVELFFIAGADAVARIGSWVGVEELAELGDVIAVGRPGFGLGELEPEPGWPRVHPLDMPQIGISATDIRRRVRAEEPIDYLVPKAVATYIADRGLYQGTARDG
ncbi:MAG: nicotinate-nucleotide adenylyltransferase [Actinomycetota bacterium]